MDKPTEDLYLALQRAWDHFNAALFAGALSPVLITLTRRGQFYGYYHENQFVEAKGERKVHEISLNSAYFGISSPMCVLSTLVHEMVHQWQHDFGKVGKSTVHNREWADKMLALGLCPSDSGLPGGKMTGRRMDHYIIDGGPFHRACEALLAQEFALRWIDRFPAAPPRGALVLYPHPDARQKRLEEERQVLVEAGKSKEEISAALANLEADAVEISRAGDGSLVLAVKVAAEHGATEAAPAGVIGLAELAREILPQEALAGAGEAEIGTLLREHGLGLSTAGAITAGDLQALQKTTTTAAVHPDLVIPPPREPRPKAERPLRLRYTCPACDTQILGGPELSLCCTSASHEGRPVPMVAAKAADSRPATDTGAAAVPAVAKPEPEVEAASEAPF